MAFATGEGGRGAFKERRDLEELGNLGELSGRVQTGVRGSPPAGQEVLPHGHERHEVVRLKHEPDRVPPVVASPPPGQFLHGGSVDLEKLSWQLGAFLREIDAQASPPGEREVAAERDGVDPREARDTFVETREELPAGCIVVTGSEKAFSAGADIKYMAGATSPADMLNSPSIACG